MPWKNGGGVTTEIAVFPEGAGLDDFDWRLSMAPVTGKAPFSLFAGVDRTLAVLEGDGIVLSLEGQPDVTLTRAAPPFAFAADRRSSARLISGPIVDLNLMTRRGRFRHRLERIERGLVVTPPNVALAIVFCAAGSATVSAGDERASLAVHDAAVCDTQCRIDAGEASEIFAATLERE